MEHIKNKAMTKQQAIEAMKEGKKVTHRYFSPNEWMTSNHHGTHYILEDGVVVWQREFWKYRQGEAWEDGYSLFDNEDDKDKASQVRYPNCTCKEICTTCFMY